MVIYPAIGGIVVVVVEIVVIAKEVSIAEGETIFK